MRSCYIGCSGFHYKEWKSVFYPEGLAQSKWFAYYAAHFKTLELNVTFYRFPKLLFLQNWYSKSPDVFRFSVKAPQAITHYKLFVNAKQMTDEFYSVVKEGLREKLGCILFQLPPRLQYNKEKLQQIIDTFDLSFANVLEFRHASWWNEETYKILAEHHITFCGISHPTLPADVIQNTGIVYYRLHGAPQLYKSAYDTATLRKIADEINANNAAQEIFIYFNNTMTVGSIVNANEIAGMMGSRL